MLLKGIRYLGLFADHSPKSKDTIYDFFENICDYLVLVLSIKNNFF
jgi:hypothetical protein